MQSITSNLIAAKNLLASGDPFIWLAKLEIYYNGSLQDTKRYTSAAEDITWDSQTWLARPLQVALPEAKELGEVPQGELVVGNIDREVTELAEAYGGLLGSLVSLYLVNYAYLNPADKFEFVYEIIDHVEAGPVSRLVIGGAECSMFPRRRLVPYCQWPYKGDGCYIGDQQPSGFANAGEPCDKTLLGAKGCVYHNNNKRFGGQPGVKAGYQE